MLSSLRQPEPEPKPARSMPGVNSMADTSSLEVVRSPRESGDSNTTLPENDLSSTDMPTVAMQLAPLASVALPVEQGGGSMDGVVNRGQKRSYVYPTFEASSELDLDEEDFGDDYGRQLGEKKRRLTSEQVAFLERHFEDENKLEPERKMQLASELGLQPRQVAVWFQNRRARRKSKKLELDFETLTADYKRLKEDYNALVREKKELEAQRAFLMERMLMTQLEVADAEEKFFARELELFAELAPQQTDSFTSEWDVSQLVDGLNSSTEEAAKEHSSSESISSELINTEMFTMDDTGTYPDISAETIDANAMLMSNYLADQWLSLNAGQWMEDESRLMW